MKAECVFELTHLRCCVSDCLCVWVCVFVALFFCVCVCWSRHRKSEVWKQDSRQGGRGLCVCVYVCVWYILTASFPGSQSTSLSLSLSQGFWERFISIYKSLVGGVRLWLIKTLNYDTEKWDESYPNQYDSLCLVSVTCQHRVSQLLQFDTKMGEKCWAFDFFILLYHVPVSEDMSKGCLLLLMFISWCKNIGYIFWANIKNTFVLQPQRPSVLNTPTGRLPKTTHRLIITYERM